MMLTYFVIANPSDAKKVGENFLSNEFPWFDFSSLDASVLNDLIQILEGKPVKTSLTEDDTPPVLYESSSGSYIHQIPDEWLNVIAAIDDQKIPALANQLVNESAMLKDWVDQKSIDLKLIEENLAGLRDFFKQAKNKQLPLLIFLSD